MVKTTRESEIIRRSPRLTSSASARLREKEQVIFASQSCSSGPLKRDTSETVDPTGRSNSKFMVSSQQPALNLVAPAATEDPGRQLSSSAIAVKRQQVACMNSTSIDRSIACSSGTAYKYILHLSESAPARATEEPSAPSVASTNPLKMDTASSAAAGPPGNPRGSDGRTGNAHGGVSTRRGTGHERYSNVGRESSRKQ